MRVQNIACGVPVKSQQMKFRINSIVACILAEIAVILRIYSKVKILGKLGPDDYFIMIAAVSAYNTHIYLCANLRNRSLQFLTYGSPADVSQHCPPRIHPCLLTVSVADLGFGLNIWDIQPFDRLYELLKLFWIDQIMYSVHLYSTKISILFFLRSIFTTSEFKKLTLIIGVFVALCGAATMITTGLQCLPSSFNWTGWDGEHKGKCNDLNSQTYAFGGINMACDIVILILPLPHLWKLQVKGRQKIQLFVMFSLGIV